MDLKKNRRLDLNTLKYPLFPTYPIYLPHPNEPKDKELSKKEIEEELKKLKGDKLSLKDFDDLIDKILKSANTMNPINNSYAYIKKQIDKITIKPLVEKLTKLIVYLNDMPTKEDIDFYIQQKIQEDKYPLEEPNRTFFGNFDDNFKRKGEGLYINNEEKIKLLGKFWNDELKEGLSVYNENSVYYGNYNEYHYDFEGVFYPDIEQEKVVHIGELKYSNFKGITLSLFVQNNEDLNENNNYKEEEKEEINISYSFNAEVVTDKYYLKFEDLKKNNLCFIFSCIENNKILEESYSFKEKTYLARSSPNSYKCYYNLSTESGNIIFYQVDSDDGKIKDDTKVTIIFPKNNNVYQGTLLLSDKSLNDDDAIYLIRESVNSKVLYKIEGKFQKGQLVKGKVFNGEDLNKVIYDGEFNNFEPSNGKFCFPNGDIYEGSIKDFQMEGKGKYIFDNENIFTGNFKENKILGEGEFINKSREEEKKIEKITIEDGIIIKK